jgi:hypothetical protein
MSLTSDQDQNVRQMMAWLRDEASTGAAELREELAYLLFYGDPTWASNADDGSVSDYRDILTSWFAQDSSQEAEFLERTTAGTDCDAFVSWFTPVVGDWKQWAKTTEGTAEKGIENPNFAEDPTPGTEYYWYDPDNEVYLYASTADAPDRQWRSYEDRRYLPIELDQDRQTNRRWDVVDEQWEFQSRDTPDRWITAGLWDEEVALQAATVSSPFTAPVYDVGYQMYRRFNYSRGVAGEYEYADSRDATTWLSQAQADDRLTSQVPPLLEPAQPGELPSQDADTAGEEDAEALDSFILEVQKNAEEAGVPMTEDEIIDILANLSE